MCLTLNKHCENKHTRNKVQDSKVWEHGQIKYQLYMYNTWVCMDQYMYKAD